MNLLNIIGIVFSVMMSLPALSADMKKSAFYHIPKANGKMSGDLSIEQKRQLVNLFNISSGPMFDGLLLNGALTGLGTANPTGKAFVTDNFYYQALRVYSVFDREFLRQYNLQSPQSLPPYLGLAFGEVPESFGDRFPKEESKSWKKVQAALGLVMDDVNNIQLRQSPEGLFQNPSDLAHNNLDERSDLGRALLSGMAEKYKLIENSALDTKENNAEDKFESFLAALSPGAGFFEADYQKPNSYMKIKAYLPGLYTLDAEDDLDPFSWQLKPGLDEQGLKPKPLEISIAKITSLSYLRYNDEHLKSFAKPMIKLEAFKDLSIEDTVFLSTSFGRLKGRGGDRKFSIENPADGFVIHWHPNLPTNSVGSGIAKELNKIKVEASIQRLNLLLTQSKKVDKSNAHNPPLLKPKYVSKTVLDRTYPDLSSQLDGSIIHFRAKRIFPSTHKVSLVSAKTFYQTLGFVCIDLSGDVECTQELSTNENSGEGVVQQLKNFMSKYFTRAMVGIFIPDIEGALDVHISELLSEAIDDISSTQDEIFEKLRSELFVSP